MTPRPHILVISTIFAGSMSIIDTVRPLGSLSSIPRVGLNSGTHQRPSISGPVIKDTLRLKSDSESINSALHIKQKEELASSKNVTPMRNKSTHDKSPKKVTGKSISAKSGQEAHEKGNGKANQLKSEMESMTNMKNLNCDRTGKIKKSTAKDKSKPTSGKSAEITCKLQKKRGEPSKARDKESKLKMKKVDKASSSRPTSTEDKTIKKKRKPTADTAAPDSRKRRKTTHTKPTSATKAASKDHPHRSVRLPDACGASGNRTLLLTGLRFDQLSPPLHNTTLAALAELNFHYTAPVQQAVIPLLLSHKDVAVQAATGSGKTAAFLIPAYELLLSPPAAPWDPAAVGSIVIAPTRELAAQIAALAGTLSRHTGLPSHLLAGGVVNETADMLLLRQRGAAVLVATPGRLEACLLAPAGGGGRGGDLDVRRVELLVLDEADRLLEMGFEACLNRILGRLPRQRRTGLFSATMFAAVADLIRAGMRNPRRVVVSNVPPRQAPPGTPAAAAAAAQATPPQATPRELTNYVVRTGARERVGRLLRFLRGRWPCKAMVFCLTCHTVDYLTKLLPELEECGPVKVAGMHGKMVQKKRENTLAAFAAAAEGVLLCTDVAARGLDIPDVHWIVQFDAPQDPDYFVHRVGRTARMGRRGQSVLMLLPNEEDYLALLNSRGVPLQPLPDRYLRDRDGHVPLDMLASMRRAVRKDLDLHDKGQRAFVSIIRGYREHRCDQIFRLGDLDLAALAGGLGLLRLPYMRELVAAGARAARGLLSLPGFEPDTRDPATLRYRDPVREKARRRRLALAAAAAEGSEGAGGGAGTAKEARALARQRVVEARQASWSRQLLRMERRQKRARRRERAMMMAPPPGARPGGGGGGGGGEEEVSSGEDEQLRAEAALLRKVRRRQITPAEFDRRAGYDEPPDSGGDGEGSGKLG